MALQDIKAIVNEKNTLLILLIDTDNKQNIGLTFLRAKRRAIKI
jgi:hypothetical protein